MLPQSMQPDTAKFILDLAQNKESGWRWHRYLDSFSQPSATEQWLGPKKSHSALSGRFRSLVTRPLSKRLSAAYIEWKYYSVLSDTFHGIIGFSLYNPELKFSQFAEGGMLCIIAGAIKKKESDSDCRSNETENFVWMKLFPLSSLQGLEGNVLTAQHGQAKLTLEDAVESNSGHIKMSDGDSIQVEAKFLGPAKSPAPLVGGGMNPLAGGHWIVNNRMPFGVSDGTLLVGNTVTRGKPILTEWNNAPAYFEHSFGINPLPWQGWDFFFAPLEKMRGGAVLQSYLNCQSLKQLDVTWTDVTNGSTQTTSFRGSELSIEWNDKSYDNELSAWAPIERMLRGRNAQYEITLTNNIAATLPFLRTQTAAVRCFFIGEQLGSASWTLKDLNGSVIEEQKNIQAGGEIAFARFPSLGRLRQPFPV